MSEENTEARKPTFLTNLLGIAVSFIIILVMVEVILRLFFPVADIPKAYYDDQIGSHLAPNQSGTWHVGALGEVSGDYHINSAGWNSPHEYTTEKPDNTLRVAVIGDSFIEALSVNIDDEALMAVLEKKLQESPACSEYDQIEVYAFAYSGAGLSQYLNMMRYASENYDPDVYVFAIIQNDFDTSFYDAPGHHHFLQYKIDDEGDFVESPPEDWTPSKIRRFSRNFALVRYIWINLRGQYVPGVQGIFRGGAGEEEEFQIDDDTMQDFVTYILGEYQQIAEADGAELFLVMDPDREAIYNNHEPDPDLYKYNIMVDNSTQELGIDFVDLTDLFTEDYAQNQQHFDFQTDYHWNPYAHEMVSNVVYDWMVGGHGCNGQE